MTGGIHEMNTWLSCVRFCLNVSAYFIQPVHSFCTVINPPRIIYGYFWTSTLEGPDKPVFRFLGTYNADLYRNSSEPQDGFSCRCVKDP